MFLTFSGYLQLIHKQLKAKRISGGKGRLLASCCTAAYGHISLILVSSEGNMSKNIIYVTFRVCFVRKQLQNELITSSFFSLFATALDNTIISVSASVILHLVSLFVGLARLPKKITNNRYQSSVLSYQQCSTSIHGITNTLCCLIQSEHASRLHARLSLV